MSIHLVGHERILHKVDQLRDILIASIVRQFAILQRSLHVLPYQIIVKLVLKLLLRVPC